MYNNCNSKLCQILHVVRKYTYRYYVSNIQGKLKKVMYQIFRENKTVYVSYIKGKLRKEPWKKCQNLSGKSYKSHGISIPKKKKKSTNPYSCFL